MGQLGLTEGLVLFLVSGLVAFVGTWGVFRGRFESMIDRIGGHDKSFSEQLSKIEKSQQDITEAKTNMTHLTKSIEDVTTRQSTTEERFERRLKEMEDRLRSDNVASESRIIAHIDRIETRFRSADPRA